MWHASEITVSGNTIEAIIINHLMVLKIVGMLVGVLARAQQELPERLL